MNSKSNREYVLHLYSPNTFPDLVNNKDNDPPPKLDIHITNVIIKTLEYYKHSGNSFDGLSTISTSL